MAALYEGGIRGVRFNFLKRLVDMIPRIAPAAELQRQFLIDIR